MATAQARCHRWEHIRIYRSLELFPPATFFSFLFSFLSMIYIDCNDCILGSRSLCEVNLLIIRNNKRTSYVRRRRRRHRRHHRRRHCRRCLARERDRWCGNRKKIMIENHFHFSILESAPWIIKAYADDCESRSVTTGDNKKKVSGGSIFLVKKVS